MDSTRIDGFINNSFKRSTAHFSSAVNDGSDFGWSSRTFLYSGVYTRKKLDTNLPNAVNSARYDCKSVRVSRF